VGLKLFDSYVFFMTTNFDIDKIPLSQWSEFKNRSAEVLEGGLINSTYKVGKPPVGVLQSLNPIFGPTVNGDIDAITSELSRQGVLTPRVLKTTDGKLYYTGPDGACWRALSWVNGVTHHKLQDPKLAASAASMVGMWHKALSGFEHEFVFSRPGAHDTANHMAALVSGISNNRSHRLSSHVEALSESILLAWDGWGGTLSLKPRVCHGDLKISNLQFNEQGEAIALLDLDTIGMLSIDVEMGDAWRSWCNPAAEDVTEATFDVQLFEASSRAYLQANPLSTEERESLVWGVERICLELSARFALDALKECYFGWNPKVAASRGEHNLIRAQGQLSLALSVGSQRSALERFVLS
jgi:Ser/Thr protein kinase RdoA (MazF antagonist)